MRDLQGKKSSEKNLKQQGKAIINASEQEGRKEEGNKYNGEGEKREGTGGKLGEEETVGRTPKSSQVASILRSIMSKGGGNAIYTTFVMHKGTVLHKSQAILLHTCGICRLSFCTSQHATPCGSHFLLYLLFLKSILKLFPNQNSVAILWVGRRGVVAAYGLRKP